MFKISWCLAVSSHPLANEMRMASTYAKRYDIMVIANDWIIMVSLWDTFIIIFFTSIDINVSILPSTIISRCYTRHWSALWSAHSDLLSLYLEWLMRRNACPFAEFIRSQIDDIFFVCSFNIYLQLRGSHRNSIIGRTSMAAHRRENTKFQSHLWRDERGVYNQIHEIQLMDIVLYTR